jgi:hypothetical protein
LFDFFLKKKLPIQMFEKEKENPPVVVAADVGAGGGRRRRRWCGLWVLGGIVLIQSHYQKS